MTVRARDRGATAVEVALLMPILLVLVMGIVDFGRALHAQITLTQAAREGVRVAALQQPNAAGRTQSAATGLSGVGVTVTSCPTGSAGGSSAEVQATYTFEFITPIGALAGMFGGGGIGAPITLSAKGVMPCEG
ncbi:TadE/TadG family type IV pilus assembly protein [Lentzea sp. NPDC005914]|uniref:TadE/TadG family type IV pilus assembly protein n=1 Tax=Lentzea sp. NPDC005914 TaxID=3154572 RepID=UPI0033FDF8A3